MEKVLVIDSHHLGHISKHAMGNLRYGDIYTGVMFGVLSQVLYLAEEFKINKFVFCWDSDMKDSLRKKISPIYRQKLVPTEEDIIQDRIAREQFQLLRQEILPLIGFKNILWQKGYEADDLIASVVVNNCKEYDFTIVSADTDLYQLLEYANMYKIRAKMMYDKGDFAREFGIPVYKWPQVKAIAGCTSDHISGIKGIGEVSVCKWFRGESIGPAKTILMQAADKMYRQNRKLVKLPFSGTQVCKIDFSQETFKSSDFQYMCGQYGFNFFLRPSSLDKWERLFQTK